MLTWIRILRAHVRSNGRSGCRRCRIRCETCKQLDYLCASFMDPTMQSPYAAFTRHLIGWVCLAVLWTAILLNASDFLRTAVEVGGLGGTFLVAMTAALFVAAFAAVALFLKETVECLPELPPGWPLWLDRGQRVRGRRLRKLQSMADAVLALHGAAGAVHRGSANSPRAAAKPAVDQQSPSAVTAKAS